MAQANDYNAAAAAQQSQTLSNNVVASRQDIDNNASTQGTVNYNHELSFTKTLNGPNQELGTLEWQFTLKSNELNGNGDANSKESINGYTITDSIFAGMTQEQVNSLIGFNVYNYVGQSQDKKGDQYSTGEQKITLTKASTDSDTITISFNESAYSDVINMIKLYYTMSIEDNLSAEDWTRYNNGESVHISNTATGKDRNGNQGQQGTDGKEIHLRVEAEKSFGGSNDPNYYSFGNEDTTDRILNWTVDLTKDAGFKSTDTYTDKLTASNSDCGHYITPEQRSQITLIGSSSASDTKQTVPSNLYTITFVDADGNEVGANENAVGFVINFTSDMNAVDPPYRYLKLDYKSTAKTSEVPMGTSVSFANNYEFGNQHKNATGITYTRDNPGDVKPLTIKVKKTWNDSRNAFGDRPSTITVKVLRAEADANGNLPSSPVWETVQTYTLAASASDQNTDYTIADDFPQWKYDETTDTVTKYYYKIEEVLDQDSGYSVSYIDEPKTVDIDKSDRKYMDLSLTNTSDHTVAKYALDGDGNHVTSVNTEAKKLTINGTEGMYYLFRWEIMNIPGNSDSIVEFVDTIPEGSVFVDSTVSDDSYKPYYLYSWGATEVMSEHTNNWTWGYKKNSSTSISFFKQEKSDAKFIYYTAVPVDDLENVLVDGKISNSVTYDGHESSATVDVSTSIPEEDIDHLTKEFFKGLAGGYLNYTVNVNPTGKKLSNTGTIDITDILSYTSGKTSEYGQDIPLENLNITLSSINVYPLVNGEADTSHPLNSNEYSYTVGYNVADSTILEFDEPVNATKDGGNVKVYQVENWKVGDTISVTVTQNPNSDTQSPGSLRLFNENFDINNPNWYSNGTGTVDFPTFENGKSTVEITVPENTEYIVVVGSIESKYIGWDGQQNVYQYNDRVYAVEGSSVEPASPAVLDITVPDQQPLQIVYSYIVEGWEAGNILKFANTASFFADNGEGSWSTSDNEMSTDSSATAETLRYPTIYKTDVSNYAINDLSAEFLVAKYVEGVGWVYANKVETFEGTQSKYRKLSFPDETDSAYTSCIESTNATTHPAYDNTDSTKPSTLKFAKTDLGNGENVHNFDLTDGILYKFVELSSPTDYRQPDWTKGYAGNQEFVFYYNYAGFNGDLPDEAVGRVNPLLKNSAINIPNSQSITLTATKSFSGTTEDLPENSTVQLGLYWSTSKKGTNLHLVDSNDLELPAGFAATQTIDYTNNGQNNSVTWTGMPSGHDGNPIYYFVREMSYTYGGTTYTYDEASEKYLDTDGNEGKYQPVYTRNGTNTDGTEIEVNNSEGIVVRKLWVNIDGDPVTPPNEVGSTGKMKVGFIVYGIKKSDGTKVRLLLDKETLTYDDHYEYVLPTENITCSDGSTCALADFSNFEIAENLTSDQSVALYGRFLSPETTRKISNGTGTLEIINTDVSSPTTNAVVQKIWKDGNLDHSGDTLIVELLQSTNANLTSTQLENYAKGTAIAGVYSKNQMKSIDNVKLIKNGGSGTIEFDSNITGVTGTTAAIAASFDGTVLTVTGNAVGSTELTVTLANGQKKEITVTSIDYEVTLGEQGDGTTVWTYTWDNLPYSDGEHNYYYYVIERTVPEEYSVSYKKTTTTAGQTTQITNSLPTQLTIQKEWYADGNLIDTSDMTASALPDEISVNVYQKLKTETVGDASQAKEKPNSMKIICFGDSITYGVVDSNGRTDNTYPVKLEDYLENAEYSNVTVENKGISGNEILHLVDRLDNNEFSFNGIDKMCLLIGTNDILHNTNRGSGYGEHHGYTNASDNVSFTNEPSEAPERFEYLVKRIFRAAEAAECDDFELYVGKIPYFTAVDWIWDYHSVNETTQDVKTMVDNYNTAIANKVTSLVGEGYNITMVDVCDAVKVLDSSGNTLATTMLSSDGCHPNDEGYDEIARAFYNAINNKYLGDTVTTITTPTNISMPGEDADITSQFSGTLYGTYTLEKSKGYKLSLDSLPEKNSMGVEYVYYIKENGTHVLSSDETYYTLSGNENQYIESVTYQNNGQLAADSGTVTIRNTIKTAELSIKKIWDDELPHTEDTITVRIHRETIADSDDAQQNPLTLAMSVENGSTIQIPIGNTDGIEITSNKGVNPTVVGSGIATPTTETTSKKVWKIRPADDAKVGDTATVTFTDGSGQNVTVNVEIVNNPLLELTISDDAPALDATAPTLTLNYTPTGGEKQTVTSGATYTVTSGESVNVTSDDGAITLVKPGKSTIQASYQGLTATVDIDVGLPSSFTADPVTVIVGGTAQIQPSPNYGTFTYSVNSGFNDKISVDANGVVTASAAGTYEKAIRVTRSDGYYVDVTITGSSSQILTQSTAFGLNASTWHEISVPSDYSEKEISNVSTHFRNSLNGQYPDYSTDTNTYLKPDSLNNNNTYTTNGNIAIRGYSQGSTGITGVGCWTSRPTEIEKLVVNFTDGSTYTINNSNYSSGGSGTSGTQTIVTNQKLNDEGKLYYGQEIVAGSVEIKLKGEPGANYQIALCGTTQQNNWGTWGNNPSTGISGTLDSNGEATITITLSNAIYNSEIQVWTYQSNGNNLSRSTLTVASCTVTPSTSGTQSVVQSRKLLSRFNSNTLRLGAALNYTALPLSDESETESESTSATAEFNDSGIWEFTLTSSNSWQKQLNGLPVYKVNTDGTLQSYYYWAEEIEINGMPVAGYTVSYSFTDGDSTTDYSINAANLGNNPLIMIKNTPTESPSVELPEAGGSGASIYYITGALLMLLTAAGYTMFKRRRWLSE
jgi:lysophospholipase L1-like esterase